MKDEGLARVKPSSPSSKFADDDQFSIINTAEADTLTNTKKNLPALNDYLMTQNQDDHGYSRDEEETGEEQEFIVEEYLYDTTIQWTQPVALNTQQLNYALQLQRGNPSHHHRH